ncbi:YicC family protein [Marinilabiliaceae bacterium JC040]|nr:YicC family protein [Marinilabiliaceae bacterium JC040]
MLKSMTGFGKAIVELENKKITIEVKSLNSKQLDLSTRIPGLYKEKELIVRNQVKKALYRGKVDLSIFIESVGKEKDVRINLPIVKEYYNQLKEVCSDCSINEDSMLQTVMRLPDVLKVEYAELDESEWLSINEGVLTALESLKKYREEEGVALEEDITKRIHNIESLSLQVVPFEKKRIEVIKARIHEKLEEIQDVNIDNNRFEQELIYFLEKLDITEEKVRLAQHCKYFIETVESEDMPGKKLGFITQEIGREINTLGSKANDTDIQKLVIQMKDELEKIKEQILNIL